MKRGPVRSTLAAGSDGDSEEFALWAWNQTVGGGNVIPMNHTTHHGAGEGRSEGEAGNFPPERDELPRCDQ